MDEAFRVIGPHQSALTGRTRQDTRTARLAEARRHVVATDWRPALRVGAGATNSHGGRTRSRRIAAEICGPKKIVEIDRCRSPRRECGRAVTGLARSEGAAAQPRSQSGGPDGSRRAAQNAASLSRSGATTERRRAEGWRRWRKIVTTWFTPPSGPKKMNDQQRRQRTAHSAGEIGPNARLKGNA